MKILVWFLVLVMMIAGGVYFVAFTAKGNSIVQPMVQEKINASSDLNAKISTFVLRMSEFEIFIELDADNTIYAKGTYNLFSQSFDAIYNIKLKKLENLEKLTKKPLKGPFNTDGTAQGDLSFMEIDGVSDIALSQTSYHVELTDLNPTSIIANIKNADLVTLLELVGEKPYAKAKLDIDVNFKNITPHELDGDILLVTKNGKLNTALMNKELDLNIPKTNFTMKLDAKLKGDDVDYTYTLKSTLAKITSNGIVTPQPLKLNLKYNIDVKELAILQPITKADIRGPLNLHGTVKGNKELLTINGMSDVAASDTVFSVILKDFKASSLEATIKNLQVQKALYMAKQPHYADGLFDLNAKISDLRKGNLKGTVITNIKDGVANSKYITKENKFKTPMPKTKFSLNSYTILDGDFADTKLDLESTLAHIDIEQARYNLKDKSLETDYTVNVPNLNKLYFVLERRIKGSLKAEGTVKKAKDLVVTLHSKIAGGKLDIKLFNDDLTADVKSIQTIDAMNMFAYPPVFRSAINGVLNYNTKEKVGKFRGDLVEGRFEDNTAFTLVKQYAGIDMYKQKFKGMVSADINKEVVFASFDLRSNTSSIKTVNTKINSHTNQIKSKIVIVANNNPITVLLSGNKSAPKVTVDAEDIVKEQIKKEATKQIGNFLQKLF